MANLWDHVEEQAALRRVPRLEFWRRVLNAIVAGDLPVQYPRNVPGMPAWRDWLIGVRDATNRFNDLSGCAPKLNLITVEVARFRAWADKEFSPRRGPTPGENNYRSADAKLFPEITRLMRSGQARSPRAAVMLIMEHEGETAVAGHGSRESKAKRVCGLYLKSASARRNP